jgi:SpoVK/Ycf46/Vps4 family AAA+-type ATPase
MPLTLKLSLPNQSLPKDIVRNLIAMWGLRFALNHEIRAKVINANWLSLVGESVEWPVELLNKFYGATNEENNEEQTGLLVHKKLINWSAVFQYFEETYSNQPELLNNCLENSIEKLEQYWLVTRDQDTAWKNITLLGELLHLTDFECKVLLFFVYMESSRQLRILFREMEIESTLKAAEILAGLLGSTSQQVMDVLDQKKVLMSSGLLSKGHNFEFFFEFIVVSEHVQYALTYPNKDLSELMLHFTNESTSGQLAVEDIPHLQNTLTMLTNVMSNALKTKAHGVNILLYGASGTGKTEFAKLLAKQVGATLYEVGCTDSYGHSATDRERYVSLLMAQNFLVARDDAFLLFDEVEDVLEGGTKVVDNKNYNRFSKAWVNHQLQNNPVPIIWICNDHHFIDLAYLRRFLFHLEFRVPPRSVRQMIAERYFKNLTLPELTLKKISQYTHLSPAQLENTARLLTLNGCHDQTESAVLLNMAIKNSMEVMGQSMTKNVIKSITPYRLNYLNVDTQLPISRILEALQKRPQASLCFYGPPGTGKTQFAEYLAEQLDQNIIIKRASDLLSKWVGESEQNIAAMFKEAENESAILFLDEGDSFLRDRQGMTKNWEVSQVNELLQQMEDYKGIFICATNLFDRIDKAALRRFTFKIHFDYLKSHQRWELFAESLGLSPLTLSDKHQQRLQKLDKLTPGDFANALRQTYIWDELPTPNNLLQQLEKECELKNTNRKQNSIGFI